LIALRLLVGLGIGGTWPNGVALVSEAWSNASRPMLAGMMGAAGNVGLGGMAALGMWIDIRPATRTMIRIALIGCSTATADYGDVISRLRIRRKDFGRGSPAGGR
jgi:MFS family permease